MAGELGHERRPRSGDRAVAGHEHDRRAVAALQDPDGAAAEVEAVLGDGDAVAGEGGVLGEPERRDGISLGHGRRFAAPRVAHIRVSP